MRDFLAPSGQGYDAESVRVKKVLTGGPNLLVMERDCRRGGPPISRAHVSARRGVEVLGRREWAAT